jgi:glycerol-3-phosphate dehydrogenase (NAD(P)+)
MAEKRAAVLGAGSWGTALAKVLVDNGYGVRLWGRSPELCSDINALHENPRYLPGIRLPLSIHASAHLPAVLDGAELVVLVVPSHALRELAQTVADILPRGVPLVNAMKGIEQNTLELPSQILCSVLAQELHAQLTFLSGPSFAREVALGVPTAVLMAGSDPEVTHRAQHAFGNQRLRVYSTDDVVGVELGGALKNVIAIAAGIADGMQFGHNSRAGIITRGLHEIARLATKLGAHPLTMSGLSGMGDLVLTCTGDLSRNRHVGIELGKGRKLADVLAEMSMVAEGVRTAESAHALAQREGVEMPIVAGVYRILYEGVEPRQEVQDLMARALRPERDL